MKEFAGQFRHRHCRRLRLRTVKIARLSPLPISPSRRPTVQRLSLMSFLTGNIELERKMTPL